MNDDVKRIQQALGVLVFVVGGAVRDLQLGLTPGDIDLASELLPAEATSRLEAAGFRVLPTGVEHGTITVMVNGVGYEHTTFRNDISPDGRRTVVRFTTDIIDDLARRDFTINAMAMDVESGRIVDPFNGRSDLSRGLLRCVGNAWTRMGEDYLRIIRAARFAARFDLTISAPTEEAMKRSVDMILDHVSIERIVQEFDKAFSYGGVVAARFLRTLWNIGFLQQLIPETKEWATLIQNPKYHPEGSVLAHTFEVVERSTGVDAIWAALLHDIGKGISAVRTSDGWYRFPFHALHGTEIIAELAERLKLSTHRSQLYTSLTGLHHHPSEILRKPPHQQDAYTRRFQAQAAESARRLGMSFAEFMNRLQNLVVADMGAASDLMKAFIPVDIKPRVTSAELIKIGYAPGPSFGAMLKITYAFQLETGVTDPAILIAMAECHRNGPMFGPHP